jgi:hypothetical protein
MKISKRFVFLNTFMLAMIGGSIFVNFSLFTARSLILEKGEGIKSYGA